MALIHCPECNAEISDTAETCPHCGCNPKAIEHFEQKANPLSEGVPSSRGTGIFCILCGIIGVPIGISLIAVVIGILILIGAVMLFFAGCRMVGEKKQTGHCPYCDTELTVTMTDSEKTTKCPSCNNLIKQTATTLENLH